MSLERTRKSIENLEQKPHITAAQMFDAITRFVRETFVHNGAEDITQMAQGSREDLILHTYALSEMLLSVIEQNQDIIGKQEDAAQLQDIFSQIGKTRDDLAEKSREIKKLQSQKALLSEKKEKLEQKQKDGWKLKKECDALEKEIDKLNDAAFDDMKQKQEALAEELKQRTMRQEEMHQQICVYHKKIEEETEAAQNAEKEKKKTESEYQRALEQKKDLEKAVRDYAAKKKECEAWILECKTANAQMLQNSEEYTAKCVQIYTAVNSIFHEQYIREHLYTQTGDGSKLTPDTHPDFALFPEQIDSLDSFQTWLDAIQKRIEGLLDVYQEALGSLTECISCMTADQP